MKESDLPQSSITSSILKCCFEVMNELGTGFLESIYRNALYMELQREGLYSQMERPFEVFYKNKKIGFYKADLVVEESVIVEIKCSRCLLIEHKAQVINYLKASNLPVGLLVNFGQTKLEYNRLHHPKTHPFVVATEPISIRLNQIE